FDIGGALERNGYLVRAKPSELRPQRTLVRRQLRQTGERHLPSCGLRRICVPTPPASSSASPFSPLSGLSLWVVTEFSISAALAGLMKQESLPRTRQGQSGSAFAPANGRAAARMPCPPRTGGDDRGAPICSPRLRERTVCHHTLKISAYRFLTASACESTPSGSSLISLISASLRTPGFSTVWECGEYWRGESNSSCWLVITSVQFCNSL